MKEKEVREIAARWLSSVEQVEEIEEGILNHVWRVEGADRSCIVKYVPPHIADQPEIPLSQHRAIVQEDAAVGAQGGHGPGNPWPSRQVPGRTAGPPVATCKIFQLARFAHTNCGNLMSSDRCWSWKILTTIDISGIYYVRVCQLNHILISWLNS